MKMNILLLGANGHLGKMLLKNLLEEPDYVVQTLTNEPFKFEGTKNITGSALNHDELVKAAYGMDMIISTLEIDNIENFKIAADNAANVAIEADIPLIWSGGSAHLVDKDGKRLIDSKFEDKLKNIEGCEVGQVAAMNIFLDKKNLEFVYAATPLVMDLKRPEAEFKIEATDKALYNKDGESIIGYKTQAKILRWLADSYETFVNKCVTSVEVKK